MTTTTTTTTITEEERYTLTQIEQCLHTLQSTSTSTSLRLELEANLASFQKTRGSHVLSCKALHAFLVHFTTAHSNPTISIQNSHQVHNVSPHMVHFLCSVIEYWGGNLARLQSLGSNNNNNNSSSEVVAVIEFVQMVRMILIQSYVLQSIVPNKYSNSSSLSCVSSMSEQELAEFKVKLNLIQQQIKLAYCRMGRCIWGSEELDLIIQDNSTSYGFVSDCLILASNRDMPGYQECGCAVLATFCEELSRDDLMLSSPIPASRTVQLRKALNKNLAQIVTCVANVIAQSLQSSTMQSHRLHENASIVKNCLICTTSILGFDRCLQLKEVDISTAMSLDLIRSLFAVIDLAAQADGHTDIGSEVIEAGAYAFDCLSEVINKTCWPKGEAENFVVELSSHALKSLAIECSAIETGRRGEDEPICVEHFRSQASHFLETFCMNQLSRASQLPPSTFDLLHFLQLMARYTFALPSALEQTDCLVSWIRVAEFFEEASASALPSQNFMSSHGNGLAEILIAVIRLNLFSTNKEKLGELDGEELEFPDESVDVYQHDVDIHFEETSHSWQKGHNSSTATSTHNHLPSHIDAALRSSEKGSLLAESCVLSALLCSISAQCAINAYENVTNHLKQHISQLNILTADNQNSSMDDDNAAMMDTISWDICACYRFLDSGLVALTALSHRRNLSNGESALHELWELCNIIVSTSESLLSSRSWSKYSNLAYILSTSCSCLATLQRGLCALALNDDIVRSPAETFAIKLLEFGSFALNSFTTLPAPSFVVSAVCTLLKSCADSLSSSLIGPKYLQLGDTSFSLKCRECALSILERRSSLSQRQLQLIYQSSVKLIFPLGNVENTSTFSPILKALFDEQGSLWVTMVVFGLCQELVSKSTELQNLPNEASPMRLLQKCGVTIQRTSQALTSILVELSTMGGGSRLMMANAIGNSMDHVGFLTRVYVTYSMKGGASIVSAYHIFRDFTKTCLYELTILLERCQQRKASFLYKLKLFKF